MSWFNLWDGMKTKTCRYLLQRYLGQFFENNLNLEQLKVDLYNGKAVVENVSLKVDAFNDLFEDQGWAVELVSGHIGCLMVVVPWNALMTNDSSIEISNLSITLRPITRKQKGTTMLESMWSSVSSSMQMAEECMKQVDDDIPYLIHNSALVGLEKFAETIDNVLNRIHAKLVNTSLIVEYTMPESSRKLKIICKAEYVEYKNQTGNEKYTSSNMDDSKEKVDGIPPSVQFLPMIAKHNLIFKGLTVLTSEMSCMDEQNEKVFVKFEFPKHQCKIVEFKGCQKMQINIKQTEHIVGPKVSLDMFIGDIYVMLTPRQVHMLLQFADSFNNNNKYTNIRNNMLKNIKTHHMESGDQTNTKMSGNIAKLNEWPAVVEFADIKHFSRAGPISNCYNIGQDETDIKSTSTNSMFTSCSNNQHEILQGETSGEILKFKLQIALIVGVILHDDILISDDSNDKLHGSLINAPSFEKLYTIANDYFLKMTKEENPRDILLPIKDRNYLFFKSSSILINGDQQRHFYELSSKTSLTITTLEFCEVLENCAENIILFDRKQNCPEGYHSRPEVTILHSSTYTYKPNSNKTINKIECSIDNSIIDFDISLYDRLSAIFGLSPFLKEYSSPKYSNSTFELHIQSDFLKVNLRFPVVDGRLPDDPNKIPWWRKNIRKDFLSFDFRNIYVEWSAQSSIRVNTDSINTFYCDGNLHNVIHVLTCRKYDINDSTKKICIELKNKLSDNSKDSNEIHNRSPFSSKCTYGYASNVDDFQNDSDLDAFLPGDTEEINEFCKVTMENSQFGIFINIPTIKVVFESKQLYEIIYNRLNGDLFMWEPRSPLYQYDKLNLNKIKVERKSNANALPESSNCNRNRFLSDCSLEICIDKGSVILYAQVRDLENRVQPNQSGKFHCQFNGLRLFSVTGFENDHNRCLFCMQLNEIQLYHCGLISEDNLCGWNDDDGDVVNMLQTLQSSSIGDFKKRKESVAVVADIKKIPNQRLKRLKIAFGLNGVVLRHNPALTGHTWLNQLINFMDITDFPIEEYEPFALISQIQIHIWTSEICYRPKYIPYRLFLRIGSCTFSSNIISSMSGCTLRLVADDFVLKIGTNDESVTITDKINAPLSRENLIPILEVGLVNISLRLSSENKTCPKIDLRSSINDVHLRTCFDSAAALAQLIAYIANDKDLIQIESNVYNRNTFRDYPSSVLLKRQRDNNINQNQMQLNQLMAEALKDEQEKSTPLDSITINDQNTFDVFYFPDEPNDENRKKSSNLCDILDFETNVIFQSYHYKEDENSPQVQKDLGSVPLDKRGNIEERDFYMIPADELTFMDQCGISTIDISEDPLRIVDNHFCLPQEKIDLLQPPASFPLPDCTYNLCEMTFTWHLYGGIDFENKTVGANNTQNQKFSSGMSETYKHGVSNAHEESDKSCKKSAGTGDITGRNQEVLVEIQFSKIRFTYEIYPVNSMYASRQVLLISDIEIRDRLCSSDINKLLYRPSTKKFSQRNDDNMVIIKALHIRPDHLKSPAEECSLRVSVLPIKLNIDQDTLLFLDEFFNSLINTSKKETLFIDAKIKTNVCVSVNQSNTTIVCNASECFHDVQLQRAENAFDNLAEDTVPVTFSDKISESQLDTAPIYFREVIFSPSLPICLDYHGRRIELSRGPVTGLLLGLAQLQGSGICLREIVNRRGLLGWNKLFTFLFNEWLKDIKRNQLPNILSGIGPTNAVLQLFQGIYELFWLPIEQYNKDGRIVRGFQLGAQSFSARTALAALEITSRIIHLLQFTAETTFDMLSAGPSVKRRHLNYGKKRQGRPKDFREGVNNAFTIVKEGINDSANTLIEAAVTEHDQKGYTGAVGAVVRQLPQLVVCPAVLATQATTNILGGAKSSLVPEAKLEARDKWKHCNN